MLNAEEFEIEVGHILPAAAMRERLLSLPEVRRAIAALDEGALAENDIRQFVSTLMAEFSEGVRFPYDVALAAIAVVLEGRSSDFADEYLHDLSRLKLAEMPLSIRVARECLKYRVKSLAGNQVKLDQYDRSPDPLRS